MSGHLIPKHQMSEEDIKANFITPALESSGWKNGKDILYEYSFTDGRIEVHGERATRNKKKFTDYLLYYKKDFPIAVVEAKDNNHSVGAGMQQAINYAEMLDVPFAYSSNGDGFVEHDRITGKEKNISIDEFPTKEELWQRLTEQEFNQVAQPKLSIRSTNSTLIPLPPEKEQKRILDRLLEVLNLLPEYTKTYNKLEKLNKEFPEKLRKSILQYAMQGKLVPQDPNDEPVEVLLEKIRAEKQKLFEEGKLKKKDLEESIIYKAEDNSYYWNTEKLDLNTVFPESWKLIYFKDFLTLVSGRDLKTSEFQEDLAGTVPYLTGATNFEAGKIITFRSTNYPSVLAYKNDLLITVKGTVGEMAYNPYDKAHIARQIMSISSFVDIDLEFIRYFLSSKIEVIKSKAQSMIPGISREVLLSLVIPLPPKNEQVRITQKLAILENKVNVLKLG